MSNRKSSKKMSAQSSANSSTNSSMLKGEDSFVMPITDDLLDNIESNAIKMTEAINLSEKVSLHSKLSSSIDALKAEIDLACNTLDELDDDDINYISSTKIVENPEVDDLDDCI